MLLDHEIGIVPKKDKYIVSNGNDRYFIVNDNTLKLIRSLQSNASIDTAYTSYLGDKGQEVPVDQFRQASLEILKRFSDLRRDISVKYLALRIQIIPARIAGKISRIFLFLFHEKLFYPLLLAGLLMNIINPIILWFAGDMTAANLNVSYESVFLYGMLLMAAPAVHEFGHIAGCQKFGARHGGIGVGFYFIFPVLYSDVSGIWMLSRKERIKVNLGGIYFELVYTLLLLIISWITGNMVLRVVSFVNFTVLLQQLNPFLRYDGYWILSDLLNYPNLKPDSRKAMITIIKSFFSRQSAGFTTVNLLLAFFGLISYGIIFILLFVIFFSYTREIVEFPVTVFRLVKGLIAGGMDQGSVNFGILVMAAIFYYLVIQLIWRTIKVRFFKRDKGSDKKEKSRVIN
jgi:putative peptide zinc metalloprotease protein